MGLSVLIASLVISLSFCLSSPISPASRIPSFLLLSLISTSLPSYLSSTKISSPSPPLLNNLFLLPFPTSTLSPTLPSTSSPQIISFLSQKTPPQNLSYSKPTPSSSLLNPATSINIQINLSQKSPPSSPPNQPSSPPSSKQPTSHNVRMVPRSSDLQNIFSKRCGNNGREGNELNKIQGPIRSTQYGKVRGVMLETKAWNIGEINTIKYLKNKIVIIV